MKVLAARGTDRIVGATIAGPRAGDLIAEVAVAMAYTLLNYALGLTRVRFGPYLAGSIGMLPATVLYAYTGRLAGDLAVLASGGASTPRGAGDYAVLGLGLAATLAVTVVLTRTARRALSGALGDASPPAGDGRTNTKITKARKTHEDYQG